MKRIFAKIKQVFSSLLIITLLTATAGMVTSCEKAEHEDYQQYFNQECASRIAKFDYEGHTYLLYRSGSGCNALAGICHDENCQCNHRFDQVGSLAEGTECVVDSTEQVGKQPNKTTHRIVKLIENAISKTNSK